LFFGYQGSKICIIEVALMVKYFLQKNHAVPYKEKRKEINNVLV